MNYHYWIIIFSSLCDNGTLQFTFFLAVWLNTFDHELWLIYCNNCTLSFSKLKLGNKLKKHVRNFAWIKYGLFKICVIFLLFKPFYSCFFHNEINDQWETELAAIAATKAKTAAHWNFVPNVKDINIMDVLRIVLC